MLDSHFTQPLCSNLTESYTTAPLLQPEKCAPFATFNHDLLGTSLSRHVNGIDPDSSSITNSS
ncbi:hypothetical protein HMPREF0539_2267 [Lacticaseibacillus rhamnosus LMS2-1]|uniref:Uncharacterized protein n=1 Tax=Lacticaseibacillus rhamnosus (strain LMS2-1) TaxID=525361 RepID=C2JZD2_LACRM|nr:hypothetical protein HMPREF0539_2267 [Lacticaseibacillus rhamnosus LMS2-1]